MPWRQRDRSEIVHIVVTGYQKMKYPRKHYVFVIDVTWNNGDRFEVYRRYSDFFSFQTTLKALFPSAAGRRNDIRVIPALPKRIFIGRSHVARVAEARLEQINRYCQTLVSLEPKVSESGHVIGFFSPRIGDKQLPKLHLHRPASLHPINYPAGSLFEEYCALADYEAEDESQVTFNSGDKVLVMSKDPSGWWMCESGGRIGWAPPSYLKKSCSNDSDSDDDEYFALGLPESYKDSDSKSGMTSEGESTKDSDDSGLGSQPPSGSVTPQQNKSFGVPALEVEEYKAIDSYEAEGPGQVSFEEGDTITVVDKMEDGWWFVSKGQEEGWAPCSYLEPLSGNKEEDDAISSLDIQQYTTVDAYTAEEDDELSFPKGITVDVLQKSLDGWWLIKCEGKTGLAPATFLKLGEHHGPVRKSSLPTPQNEFQITKTYQQPPRKRSVRVQVSLKKENYGKKSLANAFAGAYKNGEIKHSQLLSATAVAMTTPTEESKPDKFKLQDPLRVPPISPHSSDSEDSGFSIPVPRSPRSPRVPKGSNVHSKISNFEKRSTSESSLSASEDVSPSLSTSKQPTSPRAHSPKPLVRPKPNGLKLPVKPRPPTRDQTHVKPDRPAASNPRNVLRIPEISEPPAEQPKLNMPPRPRESVIRKAHEKAKITPLEKSAVKPIPQRRSPSPTPSPRTRSPLRAVQEESEEDSDTSGHFKPQRLHPPKNKRARSSTDALPLSPTQLPPSKPARTKTVSEGEAEAEAQPHSLPSSTGGDNPFSQQMADAMLKYILASQDPELTEALKRIISSDPNVMGQLSS